MLFRSLTTLALLIAIITLLSATALGGTTRTGEQLKRVYDDLDLAAVLTVLLPPALAQLSDDGDLPPLLQVLVQALGALAEEGTVKKVGLILPPVVSRPLSPVDRDGKRQIAMPPLE